MKGWTYGAEHELGDWVQAGLPAHMKMDRRDVTVMNSNGIAADPLGRSWALGGEINTAPSDGIEGQLDQLCDILDLPGQPTINHRSNLHLHIRVPGLRESLPQLKRLADFAWHAAPRVLPLIEPLPRPEKRFGAGDETYKGELRRWRRRRVSHQTVLTERRHALRMGAGTVEQFFYAHAPTDEDGRAMHHLQPREAINLRQLLETDTIEFRHFPGTLDREQLRKAFEWCRMFTEAALIGDADEMEEHVVREAGVFGQIIPWPEYVHWREVRYRATCHDGTMKRDEIERNIARILNGEFDDHPV